MCLELWMLIARVVDRHLILRSVGIGVYVSLDFLLYTDTY
jgi:hypothetical protein